MINIFVGNLPYRMSDAELEAIFTPYGAVKSAKIIMERDTGRSKGFGFVEMEDRTAGEAAMAATNDKEYGGRPLRVNEAKPRN